MTVEGNTTQGIKCIKQGMPLIEDTDAGICLGCFLPWLAEGLGHAGEIEEGLRVIRNAQETATDHFYDAERLRLRVSYTLPSMATRHDAASRRR